jgi:hypothetical protein
VEGSQLFLNRLFGNNLTQKQNPFFHLKHKVTLSKDPLLFRLALPCMQGEAKFMIYSIKEMPHLSNTDEFKSKVIVLNAQVKS